MTFVVFLAGGWGERFWPMSRIHYPKQFLAIDGKESLIEKSVRRFAHFVSPQFIRIVALSEQKKIFRKEYPALAHRVLWEPFGRNTAAAIALAAFEIGKKDPEATLVVLPCDPWIQNEKIFLATVRTAVSVAKNFDGIVTIGIPPTYPATGYGYIRYAKGKRKAYDVVRFIEKPRLEKAKRLLRGGSVLWNSGIFVFRIPVFMQLLRTHLPILYRGFQEKSLSHLYRKLQSKGFDTSFDRGILEKTKRVKVIPGRFGWRDLGSWRSLEVAFPLRDGNILVGDAFVERGKENIFISKKGHLLAGIAVSGLVAVHTDEVTLICPKGRAEEVKELVNALRKRNAFSRYCS